MGVGYLYVNDHKDHFFWVGLFGQSSSLRAVGHGHGARALGLLLMPGGSWSGDRIRVVADTGEPFEGAIYGLYEDVSVEAELMVIDRDGLDSFREPLKSHDANFTWFCDYAQILGRADVASLLDDVYGKDEWPKKYGSYQKHTTNHWSESVYRAKNRNIRLVGG